MIAIVIFGIIAGAVIAYDALLAPTTHHTDKDTTP